MTRVRPIRSVFPTIALTLGCHAVVAQEFFYESEPNNTPATANPISGEVTVAGTMGSGDQDGYIWTVSDAGAEKLWTLQMDGLPGALTVLEVLRVEFAENGTDVVSKEKLFGLGSRDGTMPDFARNLLFEPGDYVLGFAYTGGSGGAFRPPSASIEFGEGAATPGQPTGREPGGYRGQIRVTGSLAVQTPAESPETREKAVGLRLNRQQAWFIATGTSWHRFEIDAERSEQRWEIRGQIPVGQNAKVFLRDAEGAEISETDTDDEGQWKFTDLGLEATTYFVEIQGRQANSIRVLEAAATGQRTKGSEAEENGRWDLANIVDLSSSVTGRLGVSGDSDYFRFTLDDTSADQLLELSLETGPEQAIQLCLLDSQGESLQCRKQAGTSQLPKLSLTPGDWGVLVSRGPEGAQYTLRLTGQGPIVADTEVEPNDAVTGALSMPPKNRIKGRFDTEDDVDYFRFLVTDEAQLWRFQAIGDGLQRIVYYDGAGKNRQEFRDTARRLRLENVFLMPGQHFIAVHGEPDTDYTLLARPLGPPDPDGEREPNDVAAQMQRLEMGQRRNGLLASPKDIDMYRFVLFDWDRIRLTVEPPADGDVFAHFYWDYPDYFARGAGGVGTPLVYEGLMPPGEYVVSLSPQQISDAEYHVSLERLDRFACPVDCEPNSNPALARPVPPSMVIEGQNGGWDSYDVYALPVSDESRELLIRADQEYRLTVTAANQTDNLVAWDAQAGGFRGTIPADTMTYLDIRRATDGYRLELEFADSPAPLDNTAPLAAEIDLELGAGTVKAYRKYGQRIDGTLRLSNTGTKAESLEVESATSDRRWQVELEQQQVELAPGESVKIPLSVRVPRDAWATRDVRITLRAWNRSGQVATHQDISIDSSADAVNPEHWYALPGPLQGGFNVAASRFGGAWAGDYDTSVGWSFDQTIDGLAVKSNGMGLRGAYKGEPAELVIDLAGDEPVEVAGVVLNSLSGSRARSYLRYADVALSVDGQNWQQVLFEPLDPIEADQAFVLDEPTPARFARLMFDHNWSGSPRAGETLGEFEVIATPGADISGGEGFNLGQRDLGGHVVWARPRIDAGWHNGLLMEDEEPSNRIKVGEAQSWVVAFHRDRAALIDRMEWNHPEPDNLRHRFKSVKVAVSMDSPLGPWTPVGEWDLSAEGEVDVLEPESPFWGRYVRFTTNPVEVWDWHALPRPLRIWEAPTSDEYRSVLTEWGELSGRAFWESQQPIQADPPFARADNDARERAAALEPGEKASGAVRLAEHEHWYRLDVPADQNTLTVTLGGQPTVRTEVHAETSDGERLVLRRIDNSSSSDKHVFESVVEPGSTVYLNVLEPPRNVVFTWDTSASVGPYLPVIYNALIEYSRGAKPGLDAINYMPFGRGMLLDEWYGEPYVLQTVLNDYPQRESSSAAEQTLANASRALAPRSGTKAIVLMTDAATTAYSGGLWDTFDEARPRIFALGVSSEGAFGRNPHHEQDLMEGWSAINGGYYSHLLTAGELEVAFERAQTLLREPAPYTLVAESEFREAPGPGTLRVVADEDGGAATSGAVELILDASGSMLQRIAGKRRIAIAKEVLTEAVNDWIPDGTPVALRVFGHREPNACRTDLEVPLAPLDRAAVAAKIDAVNAMNLAKTPIADSLAATAGDLQNAQGNVSVLLLTDGEETCEGDPAAAVAELQEKGIDVTLNIVGFAIDNEATEAQFAEWAEAGSGKYFAATDQAGLSEAVNEALKIPFAVYNETGERVAEGLVGGEAVILDAGYYRVVVATATPQAFEEVEVPGEEETTLSLQ